MDWYRRSLQVAFSGLVFLVIQSCGSSDGSPDVSSVMGDQGFSFTDPMDTQTLRSALITGASSADDEEYWFCTSTSIEQALTYNLYATARVRKWIQLIQMRVLTSPGKRLQPRL